MIETWQNTYTTVTNKSYCFHGHSTGDQNHDSHLDSCAPWLRKNKMNWLSKYLQHGVNGTKKGGNSSPCIVWHPDSLLCRYLSYLVIHLHKRQQHVFNNSDAQDQWSDRPVTLNNLHQPRCKDNSLLTMGWKMMVFPGANSGAETPPSTTGDTVLNNTRLPPCELGPIFPMRNMGR